MASFHMDEDVLVWFQDSDENGVFVTWEGFVEALLIRFGSIAYEDPMESLISGLKDEVKLPVKMLHPKSLNEAFGVAKIQEEYLNSSRKSQRPSFDFAKPSILGPRPEGKMESKLKLPLQRLSPAQMEERRRNGFFSTGLYHFQDSSSNVQLVELDDSKAILLQVDEDKSVDNRFESKIVDAKITLYALLGSPSPGTMRIQGKINRHCLVILIDTGSTHNVVDAAMVSVLQLPLDHFVTFEVKAANGASIRTQDVCSNVKVTMQVYLEIEALLTEFATVFDTPIGLPPCRGFEHQILLKEGIEPHQLYAKRSKCVFGIFEVENLGHIISGQGLSVDPKKLFAMKDWHYPSTIKALRGFLGLTDFFKTFTIECDASGVGLGAILMQDHRPIVFHSQVLKGKALHLSTYENELLALVTAVHKWRPYLLGRPFVIKTDQQSLKYILEQRIGTPA
ncbi:uncharacterized protein LOC142640323 [Castanea sativa]|uniref:uncharacterized protein LOC142640323 n=1 Tax=Castanea sativa TaxID=21020 RepID=UPI003F64DA40